MASKMAAKS